MSSLKTELDCTEFDLGMYVDCRFNELLRKKLSKILHSLGAPIQEILIEVWVLDIKPPTSIHT